MTRYKKPSIESYGGVLQFLDAIPHGKLTAKLFKELVDSTDKPRATTIADIGKISYTQARTLIKKYQAEQKMKVANNDQP